MHSCLFYPTTTLILDDDDDFRRGLFLNLPKNILTNSFSDPKEAKDCFLKRQSAAFDPEKWLVNIEEKYAEMELNFYSIQESPVKPIIDQTSRMDRYSDISVMLVDYSMPHTNGLDFCRMFKDYPVKKCLITAQETTEPAIKAFNEGVIDRFIFKGETDFYSKLIGYIDELKHKFFHDMSTPIFQHLSTCSESCFRDGNFQTVLKEIIKKQNAVEYYLLDTTGSVFMLDKQGTGSILAVKTENQIQSDYELLVDCKKHSIQLADALESKTMLVFTPPNESKTDSKIERWEDFAHKTSQGKTLTGKSFYYSLITDISCYGET